MALVVLKIGKFFVVIQYKHMHNEKNGIFDLLINKRLVQRHWRIT